MGLCPKFFMAAHTGWKVPPPQLDCYIGVRVRHRIITNFTKFTLNPKVGNQLIAKTSLNVEPEWEEPVMLSNCGSDKQVQLKIVDKKLNCCSGQF